MVILVGALMPHSPPLSAADRPAAPPQPPHGAPAGKGPLRLVCRWDVSVRPEVNELGALLTDDRPLPTPRRTTLAHDFHSTNTGRPLSARSNRARPDPTDPDVHVYILIPNSVEGTVEGITEGLDLTSGPLALRSATRNPPKSLRRSTDNDIYSVKEHLSHEANSRTDKTTHASCA